MRLFVTALAYLLSVIAIGGSTFFIVILLAGPHSDLLPGWLQLIVIGLGWLAIFVLPVFIARAVWQRFDRDDSDSISLIE